jgi:hypothetical protein
MRNPTRAEQPACRLARRFDKDLAWAAFTYIGRCGKDPQSLSFRHANPRFPRLIKPPMFTRLCNRMMLAWHFSSLNGHFERPEAIRSNCLEKECRIAKKVRRGGRYTVAA